MFVLDLEGFPLSLLRLLAFVEAPSQEYNGHIPVLKKKRRKTACRLYLQYIHSNDILYHVYMSKLEHVIACNFRLVSYCIHKTLFL